MRRRHPWWALPAATALVLASLLAPMEGAAYRIAEGTGEPAERGDPDNPSAGRNVPAVGHVQKPQPAVIVIVQIVPGVVITMRMPNGTGLLVWNGSGR